MDKLVLKHPPVRYTNDTRLSFYNFFDILGGFESLSLFITVYDVFVWNKPKGYDLEFLCRVPRRGVKKVYIQVDSGMGLLLGTGMGLLLGIRISTSSMWGWGRKMGYKLFSEGTEERIIRTFEECIGARIRF
jgi:hypothetical protein